MTGICFFFFFFLFLLCTGLLLCMICTARCILFQLCSTVKYMPYAKSVVIWINSYSLRSISFSWWCKKGWRSSCGCECHGFETKVQDEGKARSSWRNRRTVKRVQMAVQAMSPSGMELSPGQLGVLCWCGDHCSKKCLPLPSIFQVSSFGFEVFLGHFEPQSNRMTSGFLFTHSPSGLGTVGWLPL